MIPMYMSKVEFIIVHRQISAKCMLRSFRFSPYNLNIKYIKHHIFKNILHGVVFSESLDWVHKRKNIFIIDFIISNNNIVCYI
jgi:hypothetical protein